MSIPDSRPVRESGSTPRISRPAFDLAAGTPPRVAGTRLPGHPAVILLPGAGDVTASWLPVLRGIAPFAHVVAFDRAGQAGAAGPEMLGSHIAELTGIIDAVGTDQVILVGHSFGGLLARVFGTVRPERVAGLVLLDVTPEAIAGDRAMATGLAALTGIESALHALAPVGLVRLLLQLRALPHYPEQRRFEKNADPDELQEWKRSVTARFRTGTRTELRSVLPIARAAAAILEGPGSPSSPVAMLTSRAYGPKWVRMHDAIAATLPGSTHVHLDGHHHNIHMTDPELVVDAVRSMLPRASPSRPPHLGRASE